MLVGGLSRGSRGPRLNRQLIGRERGSQWEACLAEVCSGVLVSLKTDRFLSFPHRHEERGVQKCALKVYEWTYLDQNCGGVALEQHPAAPTAESRELLRLGTAGAVRVGCPHFKEISLTKWGFSLNKPPIFDRKS